ncbi:transposase, partial [Escherichia coli]|nr:transposase [Escherichia coli]
MAFLELPGIPSSRQGIAVRAKKDKWICRPREAQGGGVEYSINSLPEVTQKALRERYIEQLVATENNVSEVKVVTRKARNPDAVQAIEAYRGSPQLMEERL